MPSEVLFGVSEARGDGARPSLVYCGGDERRKAAAAAPIRDTGFDPVGAGPRRIARPVEPFAVFVGRLVPGEHGGSELTYRFEWFR
jgi:predicted dinucleotide-binding enzyme